MTDLKPCPFCGGPARHRSDVGCYISCSACHVDGPTVPTPDDAADAWNRRAPDPRRRRLVRALLRERATTLEVTRSSCPFRCGVYQRWGRTAAWCRKIAARLENAPYGDGT